VKRIRSIPVNTLPGEFKGIFIARRSFNGVPGFKEVQRSHRDGGYTFILQEKGITHIEIDFQKQAIAAPSVIFIHPNQVHRLIAYKKATTSSWMIAAESLQPEYLKLLDDLAPVNTLPLTEDALSAIAETASICIKLSERKHEKLYGSILKESCNTLVALVASQYLALSKPNNNFDRFEIITKAFKSALEGSFVAVKRPGAYADSLNISTPYLNECVKATTGHSVSYHIQQRVILEAKRLLYHSDKSVKEIAAELGYDDYSYFTRLFVKVSGMTPLAFRSKNFD